MDRFENRLTRGTGQFEHFTKDGGSGQDQGQDSKGSQDFPREQKD